MLRFITILWIGYFMIAIISYPYLKKSYFPQFPTKFEKFIMMVLGSVWLVSVPVTYILKQDDNSEATVFETSYDGFVGTEA